MNKSFLIRILASACLTAGAVGGAQAEQSDGGNRAQRFAACFNEENAPFSSQSDAGGGIDVEIAQAIAAQLKRKLTTVWTVVPVRGGLDKALKQNLQAGKCDAFFGIPLGEDTAEELREHAMAMSSPYVIARYVLVSAAKAAVRTPADLHAAKRIGVVTATPADLFLHKENLKRVPYGSNRELLGALSASEVDAVMVWGPALARERKEGYALAPEAVAAQQPQDPILQTRFAIVTRQGDAQLRSDIDAAIAQLKSSGELATIVERNGLAGAVPKP